MISNLRYLKFLINNNILISFIQIKKNKESKMLENLKHENARQHIDLLDKDTTEILKQIIIRFCIVLFEISFYKKVSIEIEIINDIILLNI